MAIDYANSEVIGYNPTPGPKNPSKYPFTGQSYNYYGEQQGYIYDPYSDSYKPDPKVRDQYNQQSGLAEKPPKPPGLFTQVAPLAVSGGALALGQSIGKGGLTGVADAVKGIFGSSSSPIQAAQTAQQSAPIAEASSATAPAGGGFAGAGSAAPAAGSTATSGTGLTGLGEASGAATSAGGGTLSIPAGSTVPSGFEAVGTGADGSTLIAPSSSAGTGFFATAPGTVGASYLPAMGYVAGAYTGYQQFQGLKNAVKDEDMSFQQQAALALPTFGASFLYNPVRHMFDKNEWKQERNSLNRLKDDGVFIPDNLLESMPTKGRKLNSLIRRDLADDFVGQDPDGNWVNNKFAHSRDVKDLQPTDIVNYSAFAEHDPQWFTKPMEERLAVAQQALAAGAVSEGKGSIKVDFKKLEQPGTASPQSPQPGKPIMKDPGRPGSAPPPPQTVQTSPPVRDGFGIRQSPGVYKDPKTGKTYNSVNGKLPGK